MVTTVQTPFAEYLRRYRIASGMSQEALADRAGLSARGISDLERGVRRAPRPETVRMLSDALGLSAADRARLATAARAPAVGPPAAPDATALGAPRRRLPVPPTPLVDRERELDAVVSLLRQPGVRLVTLTGPGGVGKTRLALAAATAIEPEYDAGVVWVDLAPLRDPTLVASVVGKALGVREVDGQALPASVAARFAGRRVLLVLDNVEHLLPAAPLVSELLAAAPGLAVLATGRSRLLLRGEHELAVPPLALPADRWRALPDVTDSPAVRLFVERAAEVAPDFALTERNAEAVAALCRRLDGLPLALEVASAWVKVLPPGPLLERIERRRLALGGGARDLPDRQRTLRDAIAWSYDLLDAAHRTLLGRLAVFAGGFDLKAVEAVAPAGDPVAAVEGVEALLNLSLLQRADGRHGRARFGMLETVREFAQERLAESGEEPAVRGAHADHFLALAEEAVLRGREQQVWLDRLEADHPNLRTALAWYRDRGEIARGLRLAGALAEFWEARGSLGEGRGWLEGLLAQAAAEDRPVAPAVLARAVSGAGTLAWALGDFAVAARRHAEALRGYEAIGDERGAAFALNNLAVQIKRQGSYDRAAVLYEQSLARYRAAGDEWGIALVQINLGSLALELDDLERAGRLLDEAQRLPRRVGDRKVLAVALANLGETAYRRGDDERAAAVLSEVLDLARELDDPRETSYALLLLGAVAQRRGEIGRAAALYAETLGMCRDLGDRLGVSDALWRLASALAGIRPDRAARLLGVSDALREAIGAVLPPADAGDRQAAASAMRSALGDEGFETAWRAGRTAPLDAVVAEARAVADEVASSPASPAAGERIGDPRAGR